MSRTRRAGRPGPLARRAGSGRRPRGTRPAASTTARRRPGSRPAAGPGTSPAPRTGSAAGWSGGSPVRWPTTTPQSNRMATSAGRRRAPAIGARERSVAPRSTTRRNRSLSTPACGSIAEWYFSAPAADCRHWKKQTASAPWATWASASRSSSPSRLGTFTGRQLTAPGACSIRNQGRPWASMPVRLAENSSSLRPPGPGSR